MCKHETGTWYHKKTGVDGNTKLFGVNIFDYTWNRTGKTVAVQDPLYHQTYTFPVYSVVINNFEHIFAAGEFSSCVWGFYLQK